MLDTDTKRRIDTARDILVGKVPDPKSQVEQITIALIYKFMDDLDAESEELGGERTFFADGFAKYGWAKLMRPGIGGHETLNLYAEGITRMPENSGIPPLFRDIFNNAYLPYRDPETLRAFLKVIDEFTYDHSERLGDAFEYLLSVLGAQGDAGQFRTPRHIIEFIVAVLDPKKDEVVLDPACGTAGFLISAYKHILAANTDSDGQSTLAPDERGRLVNKFKGYDISPDFVRLSLVNMYLHGFREPHIHEYDTLTSEERWNEYADVILANPPFMSPKGGIRPHNRFVVQSKRSEVLFVDYMMEHLTANGRAGIIVPEGIIFQSQKAYRQLRKMLVEDYLVAVVSLPAGVFKPYSGVKTSILILDRALARRTDAIAFFKVENDGFDLGDQRRPIERNDLPEVSSELTECLRRLLLGETLRSDKHRHGLLVQKQRIAEDGEYNLSRELYREVVPSITSYPLVPAGSLYRKRVRTVDPRSRPDEYFELWSIPAFDKGTPEVISGSEIGSSKKMVYPGDVLLSRIIPHIRRSWVIKEGTNDYCKVASTEWLVFSSDEIVPEFLQRMVISDVFHKQFMQTTSGVGGSLTRANPKAVANIRIPLPSLEVQRGIVAEIEGYQKVIDGARAVVENYRPHIAVDPEWPMVALGDVCTVERGASPRPISKYTTDSSNGVNWIKIGDAPVGSKFITSTKERITLEGASKSRWVKPGDFILSNSMSFGRPYILAIEGCIHDGWLLLRNQSKEINKDFLYYILNSEVVATQFALAATGGVVNNLNSRIVRAVKIPLPFIDTQKAIAAELEAEQAIVDGNRELIRRFEKKIQDVIARVWGEEVPVAAGA